MKKLYHSLSKVTALNIRTREQLSQNEDLYAEVFLDIDHFITNTALRSHVNINRLLELRKLGVDPEDVHYDALERCIEKLDLVLANNLDHMIPYLYSLINHLLIDTYRYTISEYNILVSLDDVIDCHDGDDNSKRSNTFGDCLADQRAAVESLCIAKDEVLALFEKYSGNCDALLCMIATRVFDDSPREIAEVLIAQGSVAKALAMYQNELCDIYGIDPKEFPSVAPVKKTGLSKILSFGRNETKPLASKVSNIINRYH